MKFIINMGIWDIIGLIVVGIAVFLVLIAYIGSFIVTTFGKRENNTDDNGKEEHGNG